MRGFCPTCEKESELNHIRRMEDVKIKGEIIPVDVDFFACTECGEEFDNPEAGYDPLKVAYEEYRRRKGMVQPQEIKAFREKYGLTQRELSDLLGLGGATLSRYENGALQDEVHDTLLRLIMQPRDLFFLLAEKDSISLEKRVKIRSQLYKEVVATNLLCCLGELPHYQSQTVLNGNRELNIDRLLSVIKRLCYRTRVSKTKLNKLLFYVDFLNFKVNGQSMTGLCYAHINLGPVPDQYETIYEALEKMDTQLIRIEEITDDATRVYFEFKDEPQERLLTYAEERVITKVIEHFQGFTAKEMVDYSHREDAYASTQQREIISYAYAHSLSI